MTSTLRAASRLATLAAAVFLVGQVHAATVIRAEGTGADGGNPTVPNSCSTSGLCVAPGTVSSARSSFESGASLPGFVVTGGSRETFDGKTPTDVSVLDASSNLSPPTIGVLSGGSVTASLHTDSSGNPMWGAMIDSDETGGPLQPGSGLAGRFSSNRLATDGNVNDGQAWVEFWANITIDLGAAYEAVGFDIIDLGDVLAQGLTVKVSADGQSYTPLGDVSTTAGSSRKLTFFGIYSDAAAFRYISLSLKVDQNDEQDLSDIDFIGLDNIFVGNLERQSTNSNLPEPSSLALLGLALVGGAVARRRRATH